MTPSVNWLSLVIYTSGKRKIVILYTMALSIGYTIQGFDIEKVEIGTKECPHLYYISAGQKNDDSLVFFVKIHYTFHELVSLVSLVSNIPRFFSDSYFLLSDSYSNFQIWH